MENEDAPYGWNDPDLPMFDPEDEDWDDDEFYFPPDDPYDDYPGDRYH